MSCRFSGMVLGRVCNGRVGAADHLVQRHGMRWPFVLDAVVRVAWKRKAVAGVGWAANEIPVLLLAHARLRQRLRRPGDAGPADVFAAYKGVSPRGGALQAARRYPAVTAARAGRGGQSGDDGHADWRRAPLTAAMPRRPGFMRSRRDSFAPSPRLFVRRARRRARTPGLFLSHGRVFVVRRRLVGCGGRGNESRHRGFRPQPPLCSIGIPGGGMDDHAALADRRRRDLRPRYRL